MSNKSLKEWMDLYARDHLNPLNKKIHMICVPLIVFSLIGALISVSIPFVGNLGNLAVIAALVFYYRLSSQLLFSMGAFLFLVIIFNFIGRLIFDEHYIYVCLIIFIVSWIGQFIGHKIEGKKPSFFEDLQFLLIGPIWVVKKLLGKNE